MIMTSQSVGSKFIGFFAHSISHCHENRSSSALHMDSDSGLDKPTTPLVSFLERLQEAALKTLGWKSNFDPKTYVDLPLRFDLSVTEEAFDKLPRMEGGTLSVEDLMCFLEAYFERAGDDMECLEPEDFVQEPEGFLPKVEHPEVREWALKVHSLWKSLSRKMSSRVKAQPQLHTLLPLPASFIIPGSRFREVYYWDSYWVIRFVLFVFTFTLTVEGLDYLLSRPWLRGMKGLG